MQLPLLPLWAGVFVLAVFNATVQWRLPRRASDPTPATAFGHILVDITVLTWMVGFSGGIANPFGSLFLILIALAALALPRAWTFAVATAAVLGFAVSATAGIELPASSLSPTLLQRWGSAVNFLLSSVVVLLFATRLASCCARVKPSFPPFPSASPATRASSPWPPTPPRWRTN